jgi:hypothetical protein
MSDSIDHWCVRRSLQRRAARRPDPQKRRFAAIVPLAALAAIAVLAVDPAAADKIKHPIAVFSGLDKITGRIITFEVATNETVQFGSLQITERVCYSRPPTETPQTDSFIEVHNIDANNDYKRIFTGWVFAGSPSLHALDHPVYDIWLLRCKGNGELIPEAASAEVAAPAAAKPAQAKAKQPSANTAARGLPPLGGEPIEVGPPPGLVEPAEGPPTRRFNPPTQPPGDNDGF